MFFITKIQQPIYGAKYKEIPIKSDSRIHNAVVDALEKLIIQNTNLNSLDVAAGKGALSQRLIDNYPLLIIDCNDLNQKILTVGARNIFNKNLNDDFNFENKYDFILAIEIIEHLENPFNFIRNLKKCLKPNGFILLSTPNIDSIVDRLWYFFKGHPYYFGEKGVKDSEGHITQAPAWLIRYIAQGENLSYERLSHNVDSTGLIGIWGKLLLLIYYPIRYLIPNMNNSSCTICILRRGKD